MQVRGAGGAVDLAPEKQLTIRATEGEEIRASERTETNLSPQPHNVALNTGGEGRMWLLVLDLEDEGVAVAADFRLVHQFCARWGEDELAGQLGEEDGVI